MNSRQAILNGVKAAGALHEELGNRNVIETHRRGNVDVFGSILAREVSLVFRPLDGLLGACVGGRGVVISTNRPLAIQRFTGAHELGHLAMKHPLSLDGEEILAGEMPQQGNDVEVEANAFAGEFLLPRWLFAYHARRQGWGADNMRDPVCVYQLSLRAGASYEATTRSLERHKIIDGDCRRDLLKVAPKVIKQQLLPSYAPDHWYRDVWLITQKDEGAFLEGQPDDFFLFRLNEKTGAGYLWNFDTVKDMGFAVISDQRTGNSENHAIGGDGTRSLTIHSPRKPKGQLHFALKRPWQRNEAPAEQVHIGYDLLGKEVGLPRAQRRELAAAA